MTPEQLSVLHARASHSPWSTEAFQEQLAHASCILCAAPHAFAIGRVTLDEAELLQIATDPEHRRQGFAAQVLSGFEARARSNGAKRAFLEVAESNLAAIALYASSGWLKDGQRPNYYRKSDGSREAANLMSKTF